MSMKLALVALCGLLLVKDAQPKKEHRLLKELLRFLKELEKRDGEEEKIWELGRTEAVKKFCPEKGLQNVVNPNLEKNPVTEADTATELLASGVKELVKKLQANSDSLLTLDSSSLDKLYKDVLCVFGVFVEAGEEIMAAGRAELCNGVINDRDATEMTSCAISISNHIGSLLDETIGFGDTLTRQQRSEVIDVFWESFNELAQLEEELRTLAVDLSGSNEDHGITQEYAEEYMENSCPEGEELETELEDKNTVSANQILRVINQPDLRKYLEELASDLGEEKDTTTDEVKTAWENLLCKMVPMYALSNHVMEGGTTLCLNPDIDYDDREAVAGCIRERISILETALPHMINMNKNMYYDSATTKLVWYSISDLQIGFEQLLRLAEQDK